MPSTSVGRSFATTKSGPWRLKASTGAGAPEPTRELQQLADALAGDVRVLLGAGERELLLDDLLGQDEPGVLVAGRADVGERAERVEAGEQRHRQALAGRVEPQRGRAGEDADAVRGPDRVPVADALGVVPHAVGVDDLAAGAPARSRSSARRRARARRRSCARAPGRAAAASSAHQLDVAADAAAGDDHGVGAAARSCRRRRGWRRRRGRSRRAPGSCPLTPSTAPAVTVQRVDAVAEAQVCARGSHTPLERLDHARPGAPGDVEARDRVAVADRAVAAALGPADVRHPLHAHRRQPRALLAGREVDVGFAPSAAASGPAGRSKPAVPSQSCHASSRESLIRIRRCSGLSTMKSPPRDQNACPPSEASGSCSTRITRLPASTSSAVGHEPGQPAADHDHVSIHRDMVTRVLDTVLDRGADRLRQRRLPRALARRGRRCRGWTARSCWSRAPRPASAGRSSRAWWRSGATVRVLDRAVTRRTFDGDVHVDTLDVSLAGRRARVRATTVPCTR